MFHCIWSLLPEVGFERPVMLPGLMFFPILGWCYPMTESDLLISTQSFPWLPSRAWGLIKIKCMLCFMHLVFIKSTNFSSNFLSCKIVVSDLEMSNFFDNHLSNAFPSYYFNAACVGLFCQNFCLHCCELLFFILFFFNQSLGCLYFFSKSKSITHKKECFLPVRMND